MCYKFDIQLEGNIDSEDKPFIVQASLKRLGVETVCGIQPLYPVVVEDDWTVVFILLISAKAGLVKFISGVVVLNCGIDRRNRHSVNDDGSSRPCDSERGACNGCVRSGPGDEVIGNAGQLSVGGHVRVGSSGVEPLVGLQELVLLGVEGTLGNDLDISFGVSTEVISQDGSAKQEHCKQCENCPHDCRLPGSEFYV